MKKLAGIILTILLSVILTFAQATTGKIVGTVSTADGIVPGATITVTDNQTAKVRTVTANENGAFEVSQLEFGTYTVKITANGFKAFTANELKIDAGREYSLSAKLEVGQISEEVTVIAGADQINSSNGELSTTISPQQIRDLPLNGRNPLSLISLQAGANVTTSSINGQRSSSTNFTRDGLNVQDNFIRTGSFVSDLPTVDDTGEFTLTTQNAGAEQGGGSSQVQLVTPRGGKDFHGALFAFNRNSKFTANSFFNNSQNVPKPFLNRNQFGGSLSGQVPIPNFREDGGKMFIKDKAFFFFNYEGFQLAQQVTASGTTLLPQARNGDFTYTDTSTNTLRTINVLTGAGLNLTTLTNQNAFSGAGGVLTVDPIIQARVLSNLPNSGNGLTTGTNYTQVVNFLRGDPRTRNSYTSRFDYNIDDRNAVNFVYRRSNDQDARTEADYPSGFSPNPFVTTGGPVNFFVGSYRMTPTNNFSNEFRAGFQYAKPFFQGSNVPQDFIIGGLGIITSPEGSYRDQGRNTLYRNFQDNAVYSFGNHSIRFGGQVEFYKFESINNFGTIPTYNISTTTNANTPSLVASLFSNNISTNDLARANSLRFLLGGIIGSGSQTANLISKEEGYGFGAERKIVNFELYSAYASDQWRIRPNLTLNLGLRYEYYTPVNAPSALFLEPVITNNDLITSIQNPAGALNYVGGNSGKEGDFTKPDWDNLGTSVSFAYSPRFESGISSKLLGNGTVIRGGFRLGYVNDEYSKAVSGLSAFNAGLGSITTAARRANGSTSLRSALTPRNGFETLPNVATPTFTTPPRTFLLNNAQFGSTIYGTEPRLQVPRVFEYSVGIQRNLGLKSVLEVRYVGSFSNQLVRTIDYNQIELVNNGFLADFLRAQNNCRLQGAVIAPTAANPLFACTDARYNPAIAGSVPLTVLTQLDPAQALFSFNPNGSVNATGQTNVAFIQQGRIGSIANNSLLANQQGTVVFHPQPNSFATQILMNQGKYRYNSLQAEVRRRFSNGMSFQVNYTFQKILGDVVSDTNDDQNRLAALQDNKNPKLNYGRPDYDRSHTINANVIYELPFGKGKYFLNKGGLTDLLFGGFQFTSIINLSSGPPLGIVDPRSTAAITTRSTRQSARTSLTRDEVKNLTGIFNTPNGIYFVDPKVLFAIASPAAGSGLPVLNGIDLYQPLPAGYTLTSVRAASPINQAPFAGQVFFFNNAGETGNLPRNFLNGLPYLNWNAGLSKNIKVGETRRLQLRMEVFNVLNDQTPFFGADLDINSNSFGRVTQSYNSPRIIQFGARFDF